MINVESYFLVAINIKTCDDDRASTKTPASERFLVRKAFPSCDPRFFPYKKKSKNLSHF